MADLSIDNLRSLIVTMPDWSTRRPWTEEQTAAWRLRWFNETPEDRERKREEHREQRAAELARGFDRCEREEREPFNDWPNGQGTYD